VRTRQGSTSGRPSAGAQVVTAMSSAAAAAGAAPGAVDQGSSPAWRGSGRAAGSLRRSAARQAAKPPVPRLGVAAQADDTGVSGQFDDDRRRRSCPRDRMRL
jgi:hypothetical protein